MPTRNNRPDPFNGFKDDGERRKALTTLVRWRYSAAIVAVVAFAMSGNTKSLQEVTKWLLKSFL